MCKDATNFMDATIFWEISVFLDNKEQEYSVTLGNFYMNFNTGFQKLCNRFGCHQNGFKLIKLCNHISGYVSKFSLYNYIDPTFCLFVFQMSSKENKLLKLLKHVSEFRLFSSVPTICILYLRFLVQRRQKIK